MSDFHRRGNYAPVDDEVDRGDLEVVGAVPTEVRLTRAVCSRFGLDRVRSINSGTEANLMAIIAATRATVRPTHIQFEIVYRNQAVFA